MPCLPRARSRLTTLALTLATAAAVPLLFARAPTGKRYAVLVGVNDYRHEKLPRLAYAEADVTALADVLKGAGYEVTLLTGSATDDALKPTKANIERQLHAALRRCDKGDTAVVAFAGHGLQFEDQRDAFFCPQDARPFKDETDSLVSLGRVYRELDKSFAGMKVLLVDACRDDPDSARGSRGGVNADSAPRPPQGVAALFSCRAGERAFESDKLKHGVFFYHVIKALRGQARDARDSRGRVTFARLAAYVSEEVAEGEEGVKLVGGGARQSPNLKADYSVEPVLLAATDSRAATAVSGDAHPAKVQVTRPPVAGRPTAREERHTIFDREIDAVAFSPDGKLLAAAGHEGIVYLCDARTGEVTARIRAHVTPPVPSIYCLAWSPDGKQLASAGFDRVLRLWDVANGNLVRKFKAYKEKEFEKGHRDGVFCLAFSPDGKTLASGSGDHSVKLWKVDDGSVLKELTNPALKPGPPHAHPGWVYGVRFTPDGKQLVSAGGAPQNRTYLAVWSAESGTLLSGETLLGGNALSLAVSPDGKLLALGISTGEILVRELATGTQTVRLNGHSEAVYTLAFLRDGRLLSGSFDKTLKLWDVRNGACMQTFDGHTDSVLCVAVTPDGRRAASGGKDHAVRLWTLPE